MGNYVSQDLVNETNQLAHTLEESLGGKTANILNFQLRQIKVPMWNQKPSSCYYCEKPRHWKREHHVVKCSRHPQTANQPSHVFLIPNDGALLNYIGSSQWPSVSGEKLFSGLEMTLSLSFVTLELVDTLGDPPHGCTPLEYWNTSTSGELSELDWFLFLNLLFLCLDP